MWFPALVAFGHFFAFFAITGALVLELVLIRESLSVETARRIQRADRVLGMSAMLLLIFGFLRIFYFEKGADYYFANSFFQIKLVLFFAVGIISAYPTMQFFRWSQQLNQNEAIELTTATVKRLKKIIHWELVLIVGIIFCASMMAKGFGV
jgi:putative membrane protein